MKINPRNIEKFLSEAEFTKFKAILLYGENIGLIQKRIVQLSKKFFQNISKSEIPSKALDSRLRGNDDKSDDKKMNVTPAKAEIQSNKHEAVPLNYPAIIKDPDLLLNEINTLSFFNPKKIITINEVSGAIPKQLEKILLEDRSPNVLIIFHGNQFSPKDQVRKFFESQQKLAIIPCYLESTFDIEKELRIKLQESRIQIEHPEIIKYIANNIGGDSAHIATEIDKLISSHKQEKKITFKEVKNAISQSSSDANCDKYIEYLIEEKFLLAESELKKLMLAEIKPHFIIRALSRYFTKLYLAHGLIVDGIHKSEVPSKLKPPIFFKAVPTFKFAIKKYSILKIIEILEQLLKLEIKIKTHDSALAKIILERELLNIFTSHCKF